MGHRILVVEDDPAILRGIELNLQLEGFVPICVTDGRRALEVLAQDEEIRLLILDIMLPHVNGYEVVRHARRAGRDLPIVMLSARSSEDEVVLGLDVGADDYVTKPFRVSELIARVKAHLRRLAPTSLVSFADVEVDLDRRLVRRAGELVELGAREYDLLALLVTREGRAISRERILEKVWGSGYFGTDRTVDNYISSLRSKLDTPGRPAHILTVRGLGYRFVAEPDAS